MSTTVSPTFTTEQGGYTLSCLIHSKSIKGVGRLAPVISGVTTQSALYPSSSALGTTCFIISEVYPVVDPILMPFSLSFSTVSTTPSMGTLYPATTSYNVFSNVWYRLSTSSSDHGLPYTSSHCLFPSSPERSSLICDFFSIPIGRFISSLVSLIPAPVNTISNTPLGALEP